MKDETSTNVWKESFLNEICFLTRNEDLRKVAGNWTWPETGPHTVFIGVEAPFSKSNFGQVNFNRFLFTMNLQRKWVKMVLLILNMAHSFLNFKFKA